MTKRVTLAILLYITVINSAVCGETDTYKGLEIDLTSQYVNPGKMIHEHPRMPARTPEAYMYGHVINFYYFDLPLNIELVDISDNDVVFRTTVDFGVSSIEVPASVKGTFIIKFINDDMVYWGYMDL